MARIEQEDKTAASQHHGHADQALGEIRTARKDRTFAFLRGITPAFDHCNIKVAKHNFFMDRTRGYLANFICLAALAWFAGPAGGSPVKSTAAANAVTRWLAADPTPLAEKLSHDVKGVETVRDAQGTALYHVVHLAPSGFVIVAADDQIGPIVAFATKGEFNPSPKSALRALANKDLASRLAQARAHPAAARFVRAHRQWQQLEQGTNTPQGGTASYVSSVSSVWVAPLLQTLWDQETLNDAGRLACYNYYTPPYAAGSTSNYPSGCVATGMAQLMYHFQYPTAGVGTNAFSIGVNNTVTQASLRGGNGAGGPYLWSNMPPVPQNPTAAQCQAIGALTSDAGVAVDMAYGPGGSGATLIGARDALAGTFLYPNVIIAGQDNPSYSLSAALTNIVNPNLDARKPVLFGIWASGNEGHCVVCDGYGYESGALYHHLNMGWSGDDNAWYALPDIDTSDSLTFTNISSCIYNVDAGGEGEIISGRIVDITGNPVSKATVTASRSEGVTYTATSDANGIYALVQLPSSSHYALTVSLPGYDNESGNWSTGLSQNSSAATGNVWGANFVLSDAGPPSILSAPQSQTAFVGGTASLTVNATGAGNLSYLWSQNGALLTNSGSSLTISNVTAADAGTYAVVVSNAYGTAASPGAVLNVEQLGGTQLVRNGGFETGSFSSWSTASNMSGTAVTTGPLYVDAGQYGAELGPSGSLGFLLQSLATTPGASYLVSCRLDSPDGLTPNEFLVAWNGTNLFDQVNMGETGWTNLQFVVTADATNALLEFGFRNDDSYFGLDAITVNNVFPATAAPQIAAQPASQTAALGAGAAFSVTASGTPAVAYQWQFNGANLDGATNSTLAFGAVEAADAGLYQVVVSNSAGALTSSAAALNVTGVPVSFVTGAGGFQAGTGAITVVLTNLTGQGTVVVQASADLLHWVPVFTNAAAFGGFQFTDPVPTNIPCRYYRAAIGTSP